MKYSNVANHPESASRFGVATGGFVIFGVSNFGTRPARRVSDNCPMSRKLQGTDYPPTSPKMHELRERFAEQSDTDKELKSPKPKSK